MIPTRRQTVAGIALLALPDVALAANDDAALKAALDALPERGELAAGLDVLRRFDPHRLGLSARLDLLTVRAGLAIDATIAQRFLGAKTIADVPARDREAYFALLLKRRLGEVDVDTARRRLDDALTGLTLRADQALGAIGHRDGTVGARLTALMADERFFYPDSDAGRDRAVADMNRSLAARRAQVRAALATVPAYCLDVTVSRPARADMPAGKRVLPAPGRPGGYIVDLADVRRRPSWTLPSVIAHELLPGHLLQLPIEAASGMHPLRADYAAGFVEGWAIYAEQFAAAAGAFDGDALALIGHLHWLLFRAARARTDIGMHCDGWSPERARDFLEDWQGPPVYFAPYDVELTRTSREPSSRTADALAWLTIADLAPRAITGRSAFHTRILAGGRKRTEHVGHVFDRR